MNENERAIPDEVYSQEFENLIRQIIKHGDVREDLYMQPLTQR